MDVIEVDSLAEVGRGQAPAAAAARPGAKAGKARQRRPAAHTGSAFLAGFDADEVPLLDAPRIAPGELVRAQTTVALQPSWVGARVVYVVDRAGLAPIIFGVVRPPGSVMARPDATPTTVSVTAESDRLHLSASREVVLECGQASITLTRAGKVVIKGAYVLSRSSGYNKIKGAVVDIN